MLSSVSVAFRGLLLLVLMDTPALPGAQTKISPQVVLSNNKMVAELPVKKIYDEDAKSWYAVYNTGNTVHVYLAVTDSQQQRKIVMNGIELWFDPKGKKNKKTGVLFPFNEMNSKPGFMQAGPPGMRRPQPFNDHSSPDSNSIHELEKAISLHHEMTLTGFKEELNGVQNIHHPSGIRVSLYFVKDTLVYEAALPLNTLAEPLPENARISIGMIEKGMDMPGLGGNGMPPDGGGPGDGMMPPPGPPPGEDNGMRIFEDNIIWFKFSRRS